jgi:two-component system response regulator HydG
VGVLACRWIATDPESGIEEFLNATAVACAPCLRAMADGLSVPADSRERTPEILGCSASIDSVRRAVVRAASAPFAVLIEGESGTGKELVAQAIHRLGARRDGKWATLNCAALVDDLLEAELFGHARGAFTGAISERRGVFEESNGGTLFLDEVSELSPRAQAKLLRVIQEGEVRRVGETFPRHVDVRLICASNRSLETEVAAGRFRADLRYRVDVIRINLPPLRARVEDIPVLARHFWEDCCGRLRKKALLRASLVAALARYDWPGNVRELQNVMAALAVAAPSRGAIGPAALPRALARATSVEQGDITLHQARRRFEERFVSAALARAGGRRARAARNLGISRQGLAKLIERLGLAEENPS